MVEVPSSSARRPVVLALASCICASCSFRAAAITNDARPDAFTPDTFGPDTAVPDTFVIDAFVPDAFGPDAFASPFPASCKAISDAGSGSGDGFYAIDPAGSGSGTTVWCDMSTDGGGWTVVFLATSDNYASPPDYTSAPSGLLQSATTVLMAFRGSGSDGSGSDYTVQSDYASFPIPIDWQNAAPFLYSEKDVATSVDIDGVAVGSATLRYGYTNFGNPPCTASWGAYTYGRICIENTSAPLFSGFAGSSEDGCDNSMATQPGKTTCASIRFSLGVR